MLILRLAVTVEAYAPLISVMTSLASLSGVGVALAMLMR
jgi:hypothetical protein